MKGWLQPPAKENIIRSAPGEYETVPVGLRDAERRKDSGRRLVRATSMSFGSSTDSGSRMARAAGGIIGGRVSLPAPPPRPWQYGSPPRRQTPTLKGAPNRPPHSRRGFNRSDIGRHWATSSWPAAGYPSAKDVVELDGTLIRTIKLRGSLTVSPHGRRFGCIVG